MARLFVAVWPPPEVVDGLRRLDRPDVPAIRWTTQDQWHVTLRFLGEAAVDEVAAALATVRHPAVEATMGSGLRRLGAGALVLPVEGLASVAAAVASALEGLGAPPADRPFHGHLTLGRVRNGRRAAVPSVGLAASWPVTELTLVRSDLHPDGARYEVVHRVALSGA